MGTWIHKIVVLISLVAAIAPRVVDALPPNVGHVVSLVGTLCATLAAYLLPAPGQLPAGK